MKFSNEIIPFVKEFEFPYLNSYLVVNHEKQGIPIPIPLPVIGDRVYSPSRYIRTMLLIHSYKCIRNKDDPSKLYIGNQYNMNIYFHWLCLLSAERHIWIHHYKPPKQNATILDAGAGCGETAWFFFNEFKAKKVICVEPNKDRFNLLESNAKSNNWNVELINDIIRPEHIERKDIDFMKMDIEGAEKEFINFKLPPSAIETHTKMITQAYVNNNQGFRISWQNRVNAIVRNF